MRDYYKLFIELSLQQCTEDDYANKQKIKKHNVVSKKMFQLQNEMKQTECFSILNDLLNYENNMVKINAASLCLQMNVLVAKAKDVLNDLLNTSKDSTIRFSAKMILGGVANE